MAQFYPKRWNRVDGALDFCDKLLATNPGFARANPVVIEHPNPARGAGALQGTVG